MDEAVREATEGLGEAVALVKARLVGRDRVADSNVVQAVDEAERVFLGTGAIPPPYDPETLCVLLENSNSLRQNIDAYVTNIDAFGHRFEPVVDLEASDADQRIANALAIERARNGAAGAAPTPDEVAAKKREVADLMRMERSRLENFFEYCCVESSFATLRRRTRLDVELLGNGYWEVLRNGAGELVQFVYVPGFTVRLLPLDPDLVEIDHKVKISDLSFDTVRVRCRFRRYVQVFESQTVFFKELGDPRVVSRKSGRVFQTVEEMLGADPSDGPATEIIHFRVHNPRSAYGVPRWIGNLLAVLGSRQAEEVNFLYFQNKSVPPLAILVSGGRLSAQSIPRIESFIEEHIKGKKNFHKVLILEAEPAGSGGAIEHTGRLKIELRPLTAAQHSDALFQNYDIANQDKVGQSFRLPRLLRGNMQDFNRACYSEDTETLTENGWKRFDEIAEGERIAAYDVQLGSIVYVVPSARHVHEVNEELLHFASESADVLVTSDHRMLLRPNGDVTGEWIEQRAAQIRHAHFAFRAAPERYTWEGTPLTSVVIERSASCRSAAVRHHHGAVDPDAWLEFVGYFVSDGTLYKKNGRPVYVALDQKKGEVFDKMRRCLQRLGWPHSCFRAGNGCWRLSISNRCLAEWLATNCGADSFTRCVPEEYLHLDERQLVIFFDALTLGDGHKARAGHAVDYSTSSQKLADQMQKLALHLGLRAYVRFSKMSSSGRPSFRVGICDRQLVHLEQQHIQRVPYRGRVYCFSVPGYGFFVTRRNGKVAIQGNTADAALHFAETQVFEPERQEFDFIINRKVLADMGIRFWRFVSKSPVNRDPATMAEIIRGLVNANVVTPEEARQLAGEVFNREFKKISAPWVKQPVPLTLAGVPIGPEEQSPLVGPEVPTGKPAPGSLVPPGAAKWRRGLPAGDLVAEAERLVRLRDALREAEARTSDRTFREAKAAELETEVVRVPEGEMRSWFEPEVGP